MNLEIKYPSGNVESRSLDRDRPLSIGRHSSCDIQIDDEGIGQMHGRVAWNGAAYEVTAAATDGIEVNGTLVRKSVLAEGDVLRLGSVDIQVAAGTGDDPPAATATASEESISLVSSDDEITLKPLDKGEAPAGLGGADSEEEGEDIQLPPEYRSEPPPHKPKKKPAVAATRRRAKQRPKKPPVEKDAHPINQIFEDDDDEPVEELPTGPVLSRTRSVEEEKIAATTEPPATDGPDLLERLKPNARRPGEQETLKSPLVLGLGGGSLALLLASATFYFMLGQNTIEGYFEVPSIEVEEGRYSQAITHLEEFIQMYPGDDVFTPKAKFLLQRAKIESQIAGSAPKWKEGLEAIDEYRRETQDLEGYGDEKKSYLFNTVVKISLGSATEAGDSLRDTARGRELLQLSKVATTKMNLYKTDEEKFASEQDRINSVQKEADRKLLKQEVFDDGLEKITTALEKKLPMQVLVERRKLLIRYAEFSESPVIEAELQKALALEQAAVSRDETGRDASTEDSAPQGLASLSLTLNTRVRTDEKSEGRTVFVSGRDCFYGVDSITGKPNWRRVVGLDLPFAPLQVPSVEPGLLLVDTKRHELLLIRSKDGGLVWRLGLAADERVTGPPLVTGGQIFLVTETDKGHLLQVSLDTGRQAVRLTFSQPLSAPPVLLSDAAHLVIAGQQEVIYTLSLRPLACQATSYLGHPAGSIEAPLLAMGGLVLLPQNGQSAGSAEDTEKSKDTDAAGDDPAPKTDAKPAAAGESLVVVENDRIDSCRLRVIALTDNGRQLAPVTEVRVVGHVRDRPMLRGRSLFVPFAGERVAAFTVSDDPNHEPLTRVATHQVKTDHAGPIHLAVGSGGHLWMASSKLQRFQLTTDSLQLNPNRIAEGISSQPLQSIGNQMFVGRRLPHSDSVVLTKVERDAEPQMKSDWRTVVGAGLLECRPLSNGLLLCVTETGGLFHLRDNEFDAPGFRFSAEGELRLPTGLATPLEAIRFADGRVAVWCKGPQARMWILNTVGTIEQEVDLQKESLEASPVLIAGGIVAPLPGRLKVVARSSGSGPVKEYPAPVRQGKKHRWQRTVGIDKNHLLVVDDGGALVRLQFRRTPSPHLYPVSTLVLKSQLDLDPLVHEGRVVLATADRKIQVLGGSDLQVVAETSLAAVATAGPWAVGNRLLVESGRKQLLCFDLADNLKQLWSIDTQDHSVIGKPLEIGGRLIVALHHGQVLAVDPSTGQVSKTLMLGQPLSLGPRAFGKKLLVTSIDGTLYRVESLLEEK
ncbi:MAG: PQQ-binding-like beta-propeller repeat protein [Planctomycetaceae bacterium]